MRAERMVGNARVGRVGGARVGGRAEQRDATAGVKLDSKFREK